MASSSSSSRPPPLPLGATQLLDAASSGELVPLKRTKMVQPPFIWQLRKEVLTSASILRRAGKIKLDIDLTNEKSALTIVNQKVVVHGNEIYLLPGDNSEYEAYFREGCCYDCIDRRCTHIILMDATCL
ncbi:hypothetical protein SLEP1_g15626 [Rubroshorea leprosula]|uniref:Uncharacterized protein n=1 Tax=Rubroshorea leprosula TaxID=152421 RepID=A0AAV5ITY6_9ROSI|nr:hypothetical protein SLEP1_g15626 [Rubroshorea leprosula]